MFMNIWTMISLPILLNLMKVHQSFFMEWEFLKVQILFVQWLLTSPSVKTVAKQQEMGFKLLSAKSLNSIDKLWINYGYTNEEEFDALMRKWYEKVRFGGKKWSM